MQLSRHAQELAFYWTTAALLALLGTATAIGCGSTVVADSDDDGGDQCLAMPICDEGDDQVENCPAGVECYENTMCGTTITCAPAPMNQCTAFPTCENPELEVDACVGLPADECTDVTVCGSTISCWDLCPPPTCDAGDSEGVCEGPSCYPVSGCNGLVEITCNDDALPQHGCPELPPNADEPCGQPMVCDYDVGGGCFDSYGCEDTGWQFIGGGCSGGGAP